MHIVSARVKGLIGKDKKDQVPVETMWRWHRFEVKAPNGTSFIGTVPGAMFAQTFTALWLSPDELDRPDLHPTQPVNWWRNTGKFARNSYEYCRTRPDLYGEAAWGLTACEGRYKKSTIYRAYGAPPVVGARGGYRFFQVNTPPGCWFRDPKAKKGGWVDHNSVIAAYGAASAISFASREAIRALRHYREKTDLWRSADCGFGDSYDESTGYVNHVLFSIDAGPMIIAIDNYRALRKGRKSAVWRSVAANPEMRHALDAIYGASGR